MPGTAGPGIFTVKPCEPSVVSCQFAVFVLEEEPPEKRKYAPIAPPTRTKSPSTPAPTKISVFELPFGRELLRGRSRRSSSRREGRGESSTGRCGARGRGGGAVGFASTIGVGSNRSGPSSTTFTVERHDLQRMVLPASESGTSNATRQPGQVSEIGMATSGARSEKEGRTRHTNEPPDNCRRLFAGASGF